MNKQAACAADISSMVTSLGAMATAASSVSLLCSPALLNFKRGNGGLVPPLRRLAGNSSTTRDRRLQLQGSGIPLGSGPRLTSCIFDAIAAAIAFVHFGLDGEKASRHCPMAETLGAMHNPNVSKVAGTFEELCAGDALRMSSTLVGAGVAMSWAVTLCADINVKAGCAASIETLVSASLSLSASALMLKRACPTASGSHPVLS